jgi:phosphate transport system substrate-binding protein
MRKRIFLAALLALAVSAAVVAGGAGAGAKRSTASLNGAGATFPAPLFALWQQAYKGATINYNPIGSGGGIQAITNHQVDFGASDAPLTKDQFAACPCVQIPWVLGATSVAYRLGGSPFHLNMTGKVLADIFLGKITRWNDKRIKALNKRVSLPSTHITPIFRSDGSGTTFNFTDYLSKVSKTFRTKVGNSTQVNFPVGVGARGSSGVAAKLRETDGGITYVDVAYSIKNHFKFFKIQNKSGKFTLPGIRSILSAASLVKKVPANNEMHIVDPPKSKKYFNAYPICTFSYVLLQKNTGSNVGAVKSFIRWAVTKGQTVPGARKLLFLPIPKKVKAAALRTLNKVH